MGLFTTLSTLNSSINSTVQLVGDLATNQKFKNAFFDVGTKGLNKISSIIDDIGNTHSGSNEDTKGNLVNNSESNPFEYAEMIASILGHAAIADGVVYEAEEDLAWELIEKSCFVAGTKLANEILENNLNKKDIKKQLSNKFLSPSSLKKISKYAIEHGIEEDFYEMACIIAAADKKITEDEKELLSEFAESLELLRFDVKRINKNYIKE